MANERTEKTLPEATVLAVDRTRLAFERTIMAWVRTATSLITFGFSVYKFFQLGKEAVEHTGRLFGPREFALLLIGAGIISLFLATIQNRRSLKALRAQYPDVPIPRSLAEALAAFISICGLLALTAVIFRQ